MMLFTKPEHIKDFYKNDGVIVLTREALKCFMRIVLSIGRRKETARAQMRKMVNARRNISIRGRL